jgi:hypothetical protein
MDKTRNQFNKNFIERMCQTANRVRVLGDNALAEALNNEATNYEEAPVMTASDMYSPISDIAMDSEAATFEQVVDALAHEFGYTAPEITGKYPRLQPVFATEQRKWTQSRALRQARG